ncbi:MAG: polymerase beta subunit [Dehalococcoidia bacterium]|nr:polymerase beta subunit [Dehalococcoidia bacterium]
MKLTCLQENLSKGLSIVGRAIGTRTTLPITNNVLLTAEESRFRLCATNLEMAITCWIGSKVDRAGSITVPARLLSEFIASLPNDKVDIELPPKGRTLQLHCARFEARISGIEAEDFPPIPQVEGLTATIEASALRQGIAQVAFAAAADESRPVLTGIHCDFEEDRLTLASADGFRLAVHKTTLASPVSGKAAVIIPARSMAELSHLLSDEDEKVEIRINVQKSQALFKFKNLEMVSQLIQGNFPNYNQLIPKNYATRAEVGVADFLRATKAASTFARDGSGILRVQVTPGAELTPGKVAVSARAEEIGDNMGEIDATVKGETAKIAFNSKYLLDVLNAIGQGQVALETTTPSSPGVIRPIGQDNYVHVIMPMFVQW